MKTKKNTPPEYLKKNWHQDGKISNEYMAVKNTSEKILVIRFSSIGDIILTTPVFRYLRKIKPGAEIHFLTRAEFTNILRNNPNVDRILSFDTKEGYPGLKVLKDKISGEKYDTIYDLHGSLRSRYISLFSGARRIRRINKNNFKRFMLVKMKFNFYHGITSDNRSGMRPLSVVEKYLITCGYTGRENPDFEDLRLDLYITNREEKNAEIFLKKFFGKEPRIVIAPGAKHFTKRWPPEYYAELAALLYKKYKFKIVFTGGPDEVNTIQEIRLIADPKEKYTVSLAGKLDLTETAAIISRSNLFISNDSGLMHMASAFQIFQIAIFGSTVRELGFYPVNPRSRILERNLSCRPCSHIGRSSCPKNHFECMRQIKPEMVLEEISDCMNISRKENRQKRK